MYYHIPQAIPTCPDGWTQLLSSCYYFSQTSVNYSNALSNCRDTGADLVLPLTEEETQMIKRASEKHDYWIGLKLDLKTSKFHTTSGLPPTYKKWNAGEPNNIPSEDCRV